MHNMKPYGRVSTLEGLSLVAACCLLLNPAIKGNEYPTISNTKVEIDSAQSLLTVVYDVADADGDALQITCSLSNDDGETFLFPTNGVTGDIGYPIKPGTRKTVQWQFDPSTVDLAPASPHAFRLKLVADDLQQVSVADAVSKASIPRLLADLEAIDGPRCLPDDATHHGKVSNLILDRFKTLGLRSRQAQFPTGTNVIGRLPGHSQEATTYIISCHYDTVPGTPGADDNSSGVVGMLEAARVLSQFLFQRSLVFIAFDQEEQHKKAGSSAYVEDQKPSYEHITGVVNFEMIGLADSRPNSQKVPPGFDLLFPEFFQAVLAQDFKGDFIANIANTKSESLRKAFDLAATTYVPALRSLSLSVPGTGTIAPPLRRSDHVSFWDAGYQALMLTDTANFRNANYHTASDTIASLDPKFLANVVKATIATAAELAGPVHAGVAVTERIVSRPELRAKTKP